MEKTYNPNSSVDTLSKTPFGKCKVTAMLPALKIAAMQFGLKLNTPHGMRVAIRICANSVVKN